MTLSRWLNRIHQGDCLKLMPELPDECIDLIITSPPYNLLNSTGHGSRCWDGYDGHSDDMPHHAYVEWQRFCLAQMLRVLKPDGAIFYNHMPRIQRGLLVSPDEIVDGFDPRQVIIWHRSGGTNFNPHYFLPDYELIYLIAKPKFRLLEGHNDGAVWRIHQECRSWIPEIPTFPVDLPRRAIRATSAKVVLDPFMGSGTTAVAAVLEGRSYIGIEQSERYCKIARERLVGLDPMNGTPSMPLPVPLSFDPSELPARGSVSPVFCYIRDAVANNGWGPTVIHQSDIARTLRIDRATVKRGVHSLKECEAIKVVNHGRWSTYELTNPPRIAPTSAANPPRIAPTSAANPPRTAPTSAANPPRTAPTSAANPPRTAPTSALATLETAPGPGPGGTQCSDLDVQNGVSGPGPGPGELRCPKHPLAPVFVPFRYGQLATVQEREHDEIVVCQLYGSQCSWVASRNLGDIIPAGQEQVPADRLASAYHEKRYRPRKWARRYYGTQQRAA